MVVNSAALLPGTSQKSKKEAATEPKSSLEKNLKGKERCRIENSFGVSIVLTSCGQPLSTQLTGTIVLGFFINEGASKDLEAKKSVAFRIMQAYG